jgi:hypothetical protein
MQLQSIGDLEGAGSFDRFLHSVPTWIFQDIKELVCMLASVDNSRDARVIQLDQELGMIDEFLLDRIVCEQAFTKDSHNDVLIRSRVAGPMGSTSAV